MLACICSQSSSESSSSSEILSSDEEAKKKEEAAKKGKDKVDGVGNETPAVDPDSVSDQGYTTTHGA